MDESNFKKLIQLEMLKAGIERDLHLCPNCGGQWIDYLNRTYKMCPECGGGKNIACTKSEWIDKALSYHADFPLDSIKEFQR